VLPEISFEYVKQMVYGAATVLFAVRISIIMYVCVCVCISREEQELLTFPEHLSSSPFSLVFCDVFCRSLFVPLFFFLWSLYCQYKYLRLFITLLVCSNLSLCNIPGPMDFQDSVLLLTSELPTHGFMIIR